MIENLSGYNWFRLDSNLINTEYLNIYLFKTFFQLFFAHFFRIVYKCNKFAKFQFLTDEKC